MLLREMVLNHLKENGVLTSWAAIELYHVTRLASIINKLQNDGIRIKSILKNKGGKRWAEYSLCNEKSELCFYCQTICLL